MVCTAVLVSMSTRQGTWHRFKESKGQRIIRPSSSRFTTKDSVTLSTGLKDAGSRSQPPPCN